MYRFAICDHCLYCTSQIVNRVADIGHLLAPARSLLITPGRQPRRQVFENITAFGSQITPFLIAKIHIYWMDHVVLTFKGHRFDDGKCCFGQF